MPAGKDCQGKARGRSMPCYTGRMNEAVGNETAGLARFLAESRWEDVTDAVRHEGRRTILNCLGTALGGCRDEQVEHALAVLRPFSGPPEAVLIGRGERLDTLTAAFINAAAANLHDFCDTHMQTIIHSAAPVVPGALALGERRHASGAQLLHAVILGVEAECRVGNAVSPWHYAHGWHITSTCGAIGAAAAAGKLLGLDAPRMNAALALGATQACGLLDSLGFMAKSVSVGNAPRGGIVAALLALRAKHGLKAADVEHVTVRAHSLLQQRTDRPRPLLGREAQVSLQHAAAMCFLHGAAGLRQFTDAMAADPAAHAFGDRISIENDDAMAVEAAKVTLRTVDGRTLAMDVAHALGSLGNPMSDAQIEAKVRGCAAFGAPGYDASPLIDAVWGLEKLKDAAALAALLRGNAG